MELVVDETHPGTDERTRLGSGQRWGSRRCARRALAGCSLRHPIIKPRFSVQAACSPQRGSSGDRSSVCMRQVMTSTGRSYFEEMYRASDDPWEFGTSPYEQRKYAVTVASLP